MVWIAASFILIVVAALTAVSVLVGWRLAHPARKAVDDSPEKYGLMYESVEFPSRVGGVKLCGWFLPSVLPEAKLTIIVSHGYAGNRLEKGLPALALCSSLVEEGFNLLMFDFRNSGESEGTMTTVGYMEKQDLLGAIDWVKEHKPGKIGLLGFSMGEHFDLSRRYGFVRMRYSRRQCI
ncbi:alpha/beta hydrolase [Paenibacillus hexagrammi]|uniref:Alpha/beta hydrolase n=1 Tax=Paenibacillus hexagrammi TaxID=2908839 RepID=A0ABY3SQG6_9BACL|nr:alpha/beta hydrolase [Paenibacillus sp. YPD9-1]UJF35217.1 alpha/beta hydrolase [Paenibacillus sp. YPD9-1]